MLHAVVMAGGAGTRFWPQSRRARPKQFLALLGGRTMLQATVDRLGTVVPVERVVVATTTHLAESVAEQLPDLPRGSILVEPCKRDTAPCIGLAAERLLRDDPEAVMAVMPADHVIRPDDVFQGAIRLAVAMVEEAPARMVTFGIRPTYPAETFGYIERDAPLAPPPNAPADWPRAAAYRVRKFHEKPKAKIAGEYIKAGTYYWNSGIFVWKARTILDAIGRFQPKIRERLDRIAAAADWPDAEVVLRREFEAIEPISIDRGVMERADNVAVIEAPFAWDDVGSWRALERLHDADAQGNVVDAARHVELATRGTIVRCDRPDHVVVTLGVRDLVVIVTPDATLVADKHDEESIREITRQLDKRGWREYL
ncbi:MAG: mannose-1-phosphate guanylyltransferase [Pirellulales bacterium]|nr:mannose-1-phosphate guanylyltransferase [Pirellulales bacterium]